MTNPTIHPAAIMAAKLLTRKYIGYSPDHEPQLTDIATIISRETRIEEVVKFLEKAQELIDCNCFSHMKVKGVKLICLYCEATQLLTTLKEGK